MQVTPRGWCIRCKRERELQYRYSPKVRRWLKLYLYFPIALIPLFPFMASDFMMSLPLLMLYMLGLGPAISIIRDPPTCSVCGALVPSENVGLAAPRSDGT